MRIWLCLPPTPPTFKVWGQPSRILEDNWLPIPGAVLSNLNVTNNILLERPEECRLGEECGCICGWVGVEVGYSYMFSAVVICIMDCFMFWGCCFLDTFYNPVCLFIISGLTALDVALI